jgi:hypothetical protein
MTFYKKSKATENFRGIVVRERETFILLSVLDVLFEAFDQEGGENAVHIF